MSSEPARLAGRLAAELAPRSLVWMDRSLEPVRQILAPRVRFVDDPAMAPTIVLRARRIAVDGTVELGEPLPSPPSATDLVSAEASEPRVLALSLLDSVPPDRIVGHCSGTIRARLLICDLGVLEVTPEGLVIVELAKGVSARDLQTRVEPTIFVSPRVKEMIAAPPPAIVE